MLTNRPRASSEVTSLLTRYPNLSEAQLARLINLYQDLPLLDSALLQTDRAIARGLGAFVADHQTDQSFVGALLRGLVASGRHGRRAVDDGGGDVMTAAMKHPAEWFRWAIVSGWIVSSVLLGALVGAF